MKQETTSSPKSKILLIDNQPILRLGLVRLIDQEKDLTVCEEASEAKEGLKKIAEKKPDLVILDLSIEGFNFVKALRSKWARLRILVFSTHNESTYAEAALRAGANGYLMKNENALRLLTAVRTVLSGRTYLSEEMNQKIVQKVVHPKLKTEEPTSMLTQRELETFRLIGQGYGTRQIAETLHISMKTVEAHREHIRAKYGLESNYQLVQKAIKWAHQESPQI